MSIRKQFLKSKPVCKVTFRIGEEIGNSTENAHVVGEFNNWSISANPMKRLKSGAFTTTIDLPQHREYQFRYFLGSDRWENDSEADKFVPTPFGDGDNCVIHL